MDCMKLRGGKVPSWSRRGGRASARSRWSQRSRPKARTDLNKERYAQVYKEATRLWDHPTALKRGHPSCSRRGIRCFKNDIFAIRKPRETQTESAFHGATLCRPSGTLCAKPIL